VTLRRGRVNPFSAIALIWELAALYRREPQDVVHNVALQAVVLGELAAYIARVKNVVNLFAGMGYVFTSRSIKAKFLRGCINGLLRVLLNRRGHITVVQNSEDARYLIDRKIVTPDRIRLIKGSGVDVSIFTYTPAPTDLPVRVMFISRLLWDKGIGEFVQAAKLLHQQGAAARFILVGDTDQDNPAAVPIATVEAWHSEGLIEWTGSRPDMPKTFSDAHIVCLPSYREGMPKVLLEAMASGRPCVTTETGGCREAVRHDDNGLLVPVGDAIALANAIARLIRDTELRAKMGYRGRVRAETEFASEIVNPATLMLYKELLK